MPDLSNAIVPRETRTVTVAGLAITVSLSAYLLLTDTPPIIQPENAREDGSDMLRTILVHSKLEWDLTQDGKPIPTDMTGLRTVPGGFLDSMWSELLGNSGPAPTTSSGSPSSSEESADSASTPTIPPPSGSTNATSPTD